MPRSFRIAIAIVAMQGLAIAMADPLPAPVFGANIKRTARSRQHPPNMRACPFSLGHDRPHQVAGLVAKMSLFALPMPNGEAILIRAAHLPVAVTRRLDQQRHHLTGHQRFGGAGTDTGRIQPMRFGQTACAPVVFGQAPTTRLERQAGGLEALKETPARRIHRRRLLEWRLCLGEYAGQDIGLVGKKGADLLCSFRGVAPRARGPAHRACQQERR